MSASKTTTDHDTIRKWAEGRDGHPARVKGAADGSLLRIDFGKPEQRLEEISWADFFKIFDESKLAFLYQDKTADGKVSRFFKLIDRD
ncbi:hypothetical protein [Sinorhizobium fredii]|uniref:hypothetical protein n=1 Tax=Rhizobium fredii TaxID=380 RepID=UPI00139C6175|nr:hypothetical protein [Sinorhizobium fredii]MQW95795.1 hypothetical protein [Sinorhizobium fredii]UTY46543.1 hypothetical protein EPK84_06530 [Sinorhizobium fredii]